MNMPVCDMFIKASLLMATSNAGASRSIKACYKSSGVSFKFAAWIWFEAVLPSLGIVHSTG